jgi:predicted MFS family arabinose efflux permease
MSTFLALYYTPLYLQATLSVTATEAGQRIIPLAVFTSVGSLLSGIFMRKTGKYYAYLAVCMAVFVLGAALLCTFNRTTPSWATFLYPIPLGFGYGSMLTITLVAMISAADHEYQAVITAASYAFRSTGSTIGITIAGVVYQNILTQELLTKYGHLPGAGDVVRHIRDSLKYINHLPEGWDKEVVLDVYMDALRGAFLSGLGLAVLAAVFGLGMREHTLHGKLSRK